MRQVTVNVTDEDITKAAEMLQSDPLALRSTECPVARALRRTFPQFHVSVVGTYAVLDYRYEVALPSEAFSFIIAFDSWTTAPFDSWTTANPNVTRPRPEPISFEISIPDELLVAQSC